MRHGRVSLGCSAFDSAPSIGVCSALMVLIATGGCASAYRMPREAIRLRSTLHEERARTILVDALKPNDEGRGGAHLAAASGGALFGGIPSDVRLKGRTIEYEALGPEISTRDELPEGCRTIGTVPASSTHYQYFITSCPYRVHIDKLVRIRVSESDGDDEAQRTVPGYFVRIDQSSSQYMTLNVAADRLVALMAALTYFSPDARLLEGAGF